MQTGADSDIEDDDGAPIMVVSPEPIPAPLTPPPPQEPSAASAAAGAAAAQTATPAKVVIVGAGPAGLACARQLRHLGGSSIETVVLEGRDRIGGRVCSMELPGSGGKYADLGASFIHGTSDSNPVFKLLTDSGATLDPEGGGYSQVCFLLTITCSLPQQPSHETNRNILNSAKGLGGVCTVAGCEQ